MSDEHENDAIEGVAIIGMAGRFPEARDVEELWARLRDGVDCIRDLTDDDLRESGLDPASLPPHYVKCAAMVDGIELFDAGFFGFSPREAELLDPQSRVFLECAWEALEKAGYVSEAYQGWIGVFAGVSLPAYLMSNLMPNQQLMASIDPFQILLANDRDYFATRIAYKLDLRGPALNVQTACSTSLVATHLAVQSLLSYQCTMAIAGGVRIGVPQKAGYFAPEGSIFSPDGRCRSFDAKGRGALFGEGVGVVVLKRLSEAIADGDPIHAVIRGSAFNNDGSLKVGYTAPSVEGQAEAIALAQAVAGVNPATIGYVEAHGSGTPLGDPIEVAALTRAFRAGTDARGFCAIGSIKSNVGHLESAAGIAGLIKTVLTLEREAIPPSLHFEMPNPQIDFESSPFFVNTSLREWPRGAEPRRAAVSSFGMGGTNVHMILEEAPELEPSSASRPWQLLVLSAKTATALETMTDRLGDWLEAHPDESFADAAWTLQAGRRTFPYRRALVCRDREDALAGLRDPRRLLGSVQDVAQRPVAFLLPGLGDHYAGMALGLYRDEPTFRAGIDRAAELLRLEGIDLLAALFPQGTDADESGGGTDLRAMLGRGTERAAGPLDRTEIAQPAVFAVEHALATLLQEWGIRPAALAGYSLGEYTAACLAGVLPFEDALLLVARRARLIGQLPAGAMLSVALPEDEAKALAVGEVSLAGINGPALSVLAGPPAAIEAVEKELAGRGVSTRRLPTTHAFHSKMMEPLRPALRDLLRGVRLSAPEIPYLSNVTGTWVTPEQATDPDFWVRHLVEPVRFGSSAEELLREPGRVLVEVGPGQGLTSLALQLAGGEAPVAVPTLRPSYDRQADQAFLLGALARLWLAGLPVDWAGFATHERRHRLRLPAYPFERRRYWIERPSSAAVMVPAVSATEADKPAMVALAPSRHDRPANLRNVYEPPRSDEERRLVDIWQALLGVEPIGIHDSFFQLGGHSLLAPQLLVQLRQAFGVDFPLAHLFEAPTIAELTEAIDLLQREGKAALEAREEKIDLRAEVQLDPEIRAAEPWTGPIGSPSDVFLTGATGFLGIHILADLLGRTEARVHCLVRAADDAEAFRRLRDGLEARRLWQDAMEDRIVALAGDLGSPLFGLGEDAFRELAGRIDAVYHCGAWVNFTYPYKVLKPSNVLGTVESLRLASLGRVKPVHYISSIAAVPEIEYGYREDPTVFEDDEPESISGLFGGYGETKWVSEQLCRVARTRGIPVAIYRPTVLSGDTRTGIGNTRDMVWSMIKGSIQMGVAPPGHLPLDIAPVDYVSAAIVHLSLQEESLGRLFHLPHPRIPHWQDILDHLIESGYELRAMETEDEWVDYTLERLKEDTAGENALAPFAPMVALADRFSETISAEQRTGAFKPPVFDDRNTQAGLRGSGITCPSLDSRVLTLYFDDLVSSGFLPPPPVRSGSTNTRFASSEASVSSR